MHSCDNSNEKYYVPPYRECDTFTKFMAYGISQQLPYKATGVTGQLSCSAANVRTTRETLLLDGAGLAVSVRWIGYCFCGGVTDSCYRHCL